MPHYKRRNYLIDLPFQMRFMVRFAALVLASSFIIGLIVFMLTQNSTTVAIEKTKIYMKPTSDFILPALSLTVVSVALLAAFVVVMMTLIISHRIVGPVYRLKNEINLLKSGLLKRSFKTREKDQLKDLARCLQEMSDSMLYRHTQLKKDFDALALFLRKDELMTDERREELKRLVESVRTGMEFFKL